MSIALPGQTKRQDLRRNRYPGHSMAASHRMEPGSADPGLWKMADKNIRETVYGNENPHGMDFHGGFSLSI